MNKKGEAFIILGILLIIVFGGSVILKGFLIDKEKPYYIADSINKTYYNLNSKNPNCNFNNIQIEEKNLVHLGGNINIEDYDYHLDDNNPCN